jgi:surfactin synthase thioesterase subunit
VQSEQSTGALEVLIIFLNLGPMQVFEKGNFAGLEEMKKSERLFNKVAPMGVNDIMMAVQYRHTQLPPLAVPITSFDGLADGTIDRGNMEQWAQYTSAEFTNIPIQGDHYFVSSRYREVISFGHSLLANIMQSGSKTLEELIRHE